MNEEQVITQAPTAEELHAIEVTEFVESLRELANFCESNVTLPVCNYTTRFQFYGATKEVIKQFLQTYKGIAKKTYYDSLLYVTLPFGKKVEIEIIMNREQVCKRKKVLKEVTRDIVIVPAQIEKQTTMEEVNEWECPESIFESTE